MTARLRSPVAPAPTGDVDREPWARVARYATDDHYGALRAARFLADKPTGLFDMQDVLSLKN